MSTEILVCTRSDGGQECYQLEVFQEGEHWASTLSKLDESGKPQATKVAPRFYGVSYEQARRRMIGVLESQYDEVRQVKDT
jgi:hypothetical protein